MNDILAASKRYSLLLRSPLRTLLAGANMRLVAPLP